MSTKERSWEISDLDGSNKRRVTLAQYRAEVDERKPYAEAIMAAFRRGDMKAVEAAQATMRTRFGKGGR